MGYAMLHGVLTMPYEMAMTNELSRRQFYFRAQQALVERNDAVAEVERLTAERDALRARIKGAAFGTVMQIGDDDSWQPRALIHPTRDGLARGPSVVGKRVALVLLGDEE